MANITSGHQTEVEYIQEGTYGTEPSSGNLQIPSDVVTNVSLTPVNNSENLYAINDYDGVEVCSGMVDVVLSFDYKLQQLNTSGEHVLADSIEYGAVTRANGQLSQSYTFYVTPYSGCVYMVTGAKINNWSMTVNDTDKCITAHVELWGQSVATTNSHYSSLTAATAIANTYEKFTGASIQRNSATIANGIRGFTMEINNNLERIPVVGSTSPTNIYSGVENVTGTLDIIVDAGGKSGMYEMLQSTEQAMIVATGTTASQSLKWTISNAYYTNYPIEVTSETPYVVSGVNFVGQGITLAAYS